MIPKKPLDVTWTDEQWKAIYEDNKNIIVSAGAGSGKTAVLTERVIRKLKDGIHINNLLILTFTKAAAAEMSDRIRKKIRKIPDLKNELNLLDSAYITTFDSFALSVVKKYHYLINISEYVNIIDDNVILLMKKKIINDIFISMYEKENIDFLKMINSFCVKDDKDIKDYILGIINKLDLLSDKKLFLNNYLEIFYNEKKIKSDIDEYVNLIKNKIDLIKLKIEEISFIDSEFSIKLYDSFNTLFEAKSYDDIHSRINLKIPNAPRGSSDELKDIKSDISSINKEIKSMVEYADANEISKNIFLTYDTVKVFKDIILLFWDKIDEFKRNNNSYEFNDIAIMAIDILKNNVDVRDELLASFNEIMIDEYQDTNDLQEEFISMISHNNVYMVGDIKQSIYRFRNANPYIFKNKYDMYSNGNNGEKIDLNKNFRSRDEVINSINKIFNMVMDQKIGGANYVEEHQMVFGNDNYSKEKNNYSNDLDIYTYNYDKGLGYKREELEAFIIIDDILNKCNKGFKVLDKETFKLRNIKYSDFAIIMDRASSFDLYKRIFSYYGIPISILKEERMDNTDDLNIIKNLVKFIIMVKKNIYNEEFKYLFISICRSFLFRLDDEVIFNFFYYNNFKESDLYIKCKSISNNLDSLTITELLSIIEDNFLYYNSLITVGNINDNLIKWDKLNDLASNLEEMGYDVEMFSDYLSELSNENLSITYQTSNSSGNSVKIMTIHKSKGLEYPVCYFSGLYKKFNISDLKEKFMYDKKYGIIVPYFNEGIGQTIYKDLLKDNSIMEEISEKIRLFYVALTRAREKIILINPMNDVKELNRKSIIPDNVRLNYKSFSDILYSINYQLTDYVKEIDLSRINLTHKYNEIKDSNYKECIKNNNKVIDVNNLNINNNEVEDRHFSKSNYIIISKKEFNNMIKGIEIHEFLELFDFKNPNYEIIDNPFYADIIKKMLLNNIFINIENAKIYKEYEFIYWDSNVKYHGIIDLMLEYSDYIDIIDYKLKNVIDKSYKKQLNGYKNYIEGKTNKTVNLYLYSILENKFYEII